LKIAELQRYSPAIGKDVAEVLTLEGSLKSRTHLGGTAPVRVKAAIAKARKSIA
jgi:argininosuccinate lyase